jgi:hypothetical protein
MVSNEKVSLNEAITAMEKAYQRLSAAADIAVHEREGAVAAREAMQQEISLSWQAHSAQLENDIAQLTAQNDFLKEDNLRLSNQLQHLQQDFLELQRSAGDVIGSLDRSVRQLDLILEH